MFYANSETILNNDRFFSPYIVESYPHQKEKSFNNYLFIYGQIIIYFALFVDICKSNLFLFFYATKSKNA